ncbi:MAG: hypothetical protein QGH51_05745 [Planctomycetota bacterium]|jgi:chromosome segregation ATPase|nr:hypothetical protein [Planctomycetota bacterium]
MKTLFRIFLLAALVATGAALLAGPDRIGAAVEQVKTKIGSAIDQNIDDPVALRRQLRTLEREYPERIATVRGDLAELQNQIHQLERDQKIAGRVIELAQMDIDGFQNRLAQSEPGRTAKQAGFSSVPHHTSLSNSQKGLRSRMEQAQNTAVSYMQRAQDAERDLGYLRQQEERMMDLLAQLEGEHSQFRSQLMQLDRQVDSVARNERLISLMEKRQSTLSELSRYDAGSLDQVQGKLDQIRARQEAELEMLANAEYQSSYENRARFDLETESSPNGNWVSY